MRDVQNVCNRPQERFVIMRPWLPDAGLAVLDLIPPEAAGRICSPGDLGIQQREDKDCGMKPMDFFQPQFIADKLMIVTSSFRPRL